MFYSLNVTTKSAKNCQSNSVESWKKRFVFTAVNEKLDAISQHCRFCKVQFLKEMDGVVISSEVFVIF